MLRTSKEVNPAVMDGNGNALGPKPVDSRMAGFSLIEILVAMVILVAGMVSVLALFTTGVSIHKSAIDGTHSALIAESSFALIRARFAEGKIASIPRATHPDYPGYDVQIDISEVDGMVGGEVLVKVSVFWRKGTGEGSEVFTALLPVQSFQESIRLARRPSTSSEEGRKP